MFVARFGVADPAWRKPFNMVLYDEDLKAVVDMPVVRLVGPVQPDSGVVDFGDIDRRPGTLGL